jgi:hypothetical protein
MVIVPRIYLRFYIEVRVRVGTFLLTPTPPKIPSGCDSTALPKRDGLTGDWVKQHSEELNGLHSSPNIVCLTEAKRMRLVGHVEHVGEKRGA